ncbi:hypothetical protein ABTX34_28860 [Streptomyces sp. NPDC096538]|uniref:hypothetical protein n=1 Tax=Streptomyces sp. NPDC096538 TaxID=3155427 RepID=UPI00333456D9
MSERTQLPALRDGLSDSARSGLVVTGNERVLAAEQWLLSAVEDRELARRQWDREGVTLLRCGGLISAIRLPARVVWSAAETEELSEVDSYLSGALEGPVFMDLHVCCYYALVGSRSLEHFPFGDVPGAAAIGRAHYLGVPNLRNVTAAGRSYWCVPPESPGVLCPVEAVEALARKGRARMIAGQCR